MNNCRKDQILIELRTKKGRAWGSQKREAWQRAPQNWHSDF